MKLLISAFFSILFLDFFIFISVSQAQLAPGIYSECDFCSCSMAIAPLTMTGSSIRVDTRYTELSQEFSDGTRVDNPANNKETYWTNVLSVNGEVTDRVSATLMVPFPNKTVSSNGPDGTVESISNSGIGDISLLAHYNLISEREADNTKVMAATTGVKFANGSTAFLDNGAPADPDVQMGTGTTDFFAGLGGLLGFGNWNIEADALALIRGFGNGASGHVYGDNLNYNVTGTYRFNRNAGDIPSIFDPTVIVAFGVRGEWRGYEEQDGQPLDNDSLGWSGGNVVYIAPGAQIFFAPRISFDATVWIPVVHALYGEQLGETVKILAGFQYGL